MLTHDKLVNILLFMERVQCTGKECAAWADTYAAVNNELACLAAEERAKVGREAVAAHVDATKPKTPDPQPYEKPKVNGAAEPVAPLPE